MPLRDVIRKGTFAFEPKDHQSPLRPLKTLLPVPPSSLPPSSLTLGTAPTTRGWQKDVLWGAHAELSRGHQTPFKAC